MHKSFGKKGDAAAAIEAEVVTSFYDNTIEMGARSNMAISDDGCIMKRLISMLLNNKDGHSTHHFEYMEECSCSGCAGFLYHPVTSSCGHSLCEKCTGTSSIECIHCKQMVNLANLRMNVTLNSGLEILFPKLYSYFQLISEGNKLLEKSQPEESLSKYTEAILQEPGECIAFSKRAIAYSEVGNWQRALNDVIAVKLRCKYYPKNDQNNYAQGISTQEDEFIGRVVERFTEEISLLNLSTFSHAINFTNTACAKQTYPVAMHTEGLSSVTSKSHNSIQHGDGHFSEEHILSGLEHSLEDIISSNLPSLEKSTQEIGQMRHSKDSSQQCVPELMGSDGSNFNCVLCTRLLFDPVSTECGHSFCRDCLERWFDHRPTCPMCQCKAMKEIKENQRKSHLPTDLNLTFLMQRYIPNFVKERGLFQEEEIKDMKETIPVFVCTVALPSVRCLLHVHEPRYRLMMRRVTELHEGNFGMTTSSAKAPFSKYGTILNIKQSSLLPDGRSNIATIGTRRFEVTQYDTRDGYNTAKINYIVDKPETDEKEIRETAKIADEIYSRAKACFDKSSIRFKTITEMQFGKFPEQDKNEGDNGPDWAWWVLAMIPSNDNLKLHILRKTSFRERLAILNLILKKFESMATVGNIVFRS